MSLFFQRTALAAALALALSAPAAGQGTDTASVRRAAEARTGRQVSQSDILDRLRSSGLSRAEVRSRLQLMGQDPGMADPYFDALEGRTAQVVAADDAEFVAALDGMGLEEADTALFGTDPDDLLEMELLRADYRFRADSIFRARQQRQDSIALANAGISDAGLPLFGRDLFARRSTEFTPLLTGPVNDSYVLGPGDEVNLVLTGDVELAYSLDVTRQGYLIIPDVGQVAVNGLSVGELQDVLYTRLGNVYSGVRRGREATTRFQVSLGELRTNQIYVVGEAEVPGAYSVSSLATAFNALFQAGGPSIQGTFRNLEVRRGGRAIATVDLYEYMLAGETARDIRLEHGDMLFVPLAGARVAVAGQVRRPAVYEIRDGEGLRDALSFAGGFRAQAVVERVQVTRILPPEQRAPGIDRVVIDVPIERLRDAGDPIPLRDGDLVTVFEVDSERRRLVQLIGEVNRPGTYEW
ncbi:MAG TPA: SLBB domain-containing protein, partial [Longimicrobiales bacterium]|nr:SLBB domain-containing protein [Longimicrobiales bacterium]